MNFAPISIPFQTFLPSWTHKIKTINLKNRFSKWTLPYSGQLSHHRECLHCLPWDWRPRPVLHKHLNNNQKLTLSSPSSQLNQVAWFGGQTRWVFKTDRPDWVRQNCTGKTIICCIKSYLHLAGYFWGWEPPQTDQWGGSPLQMDRGGGRNEVILPQRAAPLQI